MSRSLVVVGAGLSQPSSTRLLADQLARATAAAVGGRGEQLQVTHVELRDIALDLTTTLLTGVAPAPVAAAQRAVAAADGLVVVTPVFNASYSGLFKTFFDVLAPGTLDGVPVLVGATAGSARHQLVLDHALRPLFAYLSAVVVPTGVFAATDDFGGPGAEALTARVARAAAELAALVVATPQGVAGFAPDPAGTARRRDRARDPFAEVTPFSRLLEGHDGGS